jgi:quercetin dioxygenase-like cupin family protein
MDRSDAWFPRCKGGAVETRRALTRRGLLAAAGGLALATARRGFAATPTAQDLTRRKNGTMDIKRNGSRPSVGDPVRMSGGHVTFEPGARSAWHTHPLGQTLVVTSGLGWAQSEGGPIEEIRPGDVIWFPPDEKHWHGATATTAMTHIAITESLNGKNVDWMEKVSDEQYRG